MRSIRVFLVEDHQLVLEGLMGLLRLHPAMEIVGTARDGRSAVSQICTIRPDIVLMDISMPGLDGLEATRLITDAGSKAKVIIVTMHEDRRFLRRALKAGAIGYILKDSTIDELYLAIEQALEGNSYISPALLRRLIVDFLSEKSKNKRAKLIPTTS